jgi:arginine deiminase
MLHNPASLPGRTAKRRSRFACATLLYSWHEREAATVHRSQNNSCLLHGLWAKRAKEEHDAFAEALRDKGVNVHYFGRLLGETLELPEGRAFVLDRICTPEILGPNLIGPVRKMFADFRRSEPWPDSWSAAC